ncbi:GtrA family protein [Pontibacter sp. G13]|uniref:GtrA family protein n=1 Tax=Pontibacter sp. G13 TaxID=3074898 RepID=UPI00288A0BFF|nr:GtrA family protein [Pontibacter sp. G13]WNJ17912.1 GtrA family protein [Pontibacter sp. G13]
MLEQILKFCVVGFGGLGLDFLVTYLLKEKLKIQRYVANSIGFLCASTFNYWFNRIWTFQSDNPEIPIEFASFLLVSAIGLGLNNLFLFLLEKRVNFYIAKIIAITLVAFWNFLANYYFTFQLS